MVLPRTFKAMVICKGDSSLCESLWLINYLPPEVQSCTTSGLLVHTLSFEMVDVLTCHEFVSPVSLNGLGSPRTVDCEKSIRLASVLTSLIVNVYP